MDRQLNADRTKQKVYQYDWQGRLTINRHWSSGSPPGCTPEPELGYHCDDGYVVDSIQYFAYDSVGNRTDRGGSYATGNRITAFDGCTYQTEYDGNVTLRDCPGQDVRFHWDAEGRLKAFKVVGGDNVDFYYDVWGRLMQRNVNGGVHGYFLWHGATLLAELDANGEHRAEYSYYGVDRLHAFRIGSNPGQTYYGHVDGGGNTVGL